jgi:hypothetical protein
MSDDITTVQVLEGPQGPRGYRGEWNAEKLICTFNEEENKLLLNGISGSGEAPTVTLDKGKQYIFKYNDVKSATLALEDNQGETFTTNVISSENVSLFDGRSGNDFPSKYSVKKPDGSKLVGTILFRNSTTTIQ